jgi:alkanesulfonate monooxygenase SsuD/methylene tetrahydromethanopterin reductase-like flavin-dependent oxidoreductase (luciferase family)
MPRSVEVACREELRRTGLPGQERERVCSRLRTAPETYLARRGGGAYGRGDGLAGTPVQVAHQLDTLADHGLPGPA